MHLYIGCVFARKIVVSILDLLFLFSAELSCLVSQPMQEDLAKMGVMIRHYNNKELRGYVRISVGKPEQTDALMECLKRIS